MKHETKFFVYQNFTSIMQKKTYNGIQLDCVFQHVTELTDSVCLTGILSRDEGGFRFEEEIRKGRPPRNPKLYDGKYVSLVRMVNGKYQMHAKTMSLEPGFEPTDIACGFYHDVISALKIIE